MDQPRIVDRPAFQVAGRKTYISAQDNALFGQFWQRCQADGLFETFAALDLLNPGPQTGGVTLGVSRVETDPTRRDFDYMIAAELPAGARAEGLEVYTVPACRWAVFASSGPVPDALVVAEIYAFSQWLPASGCGHALAPEMEVYPPGQAGEPYCEFWLPITP